jgi:hypothetical protein
MVWTLAPLRQRNAAQELAFGSGRPVDEGRRNERSRRRRISCGGSSARSGGPVRHASRADPCKPRSPLPAICGAVHTWALDHLTPFLVINASINETCGTESSGQMDSSGQMRRWASQELPQEDARPLTDAGPSPPSLAGPATAPRPGRQPLSLPIRASGSRSEGDP